MTQLLEQIASDAGGADAVAIDKDTFVGSVTSREVAATLRATGCNPVWWRLQPPVAEAATPTMCGGGCDPVSRAARWRTARHARRYTA